MEGSSQAFWTGHAKKRGDVGFLHSSSEAPAVGTTKSADLFCLAYTFKKIIHSLFSYYLWESWLKRSNFLLKTQKIWLYWAYIPKGNHWPELKNSYLHYLGHVHSGSPEFLLDGNFPFCFSIHSNSWPLKALEFENPVLSLRSDVSEMTSSQTSSPSSWVHHPLNK